jgi:hypothetical protein
MWSWVIGSKSPTYINGPWDGGLVPMPYWFLDEIKLPMEITNDTISYALYQLDDLTNDFVYKESKTIGKEEADEQ